MRRRRKLWVILLATPLVLLAGVTIYWWIAVGSVERDFAAWEAEQRAAGWAARHGPPVRGGWPLAATLTIPDMSVAQEGGIAWSAERLVLRVALLQPTLLDIAAQGRQRLHLPRDTEIPFTADELRLTVPLQAAPWPDFADVSAADLRAEMPVGGGAGVQSLRLHLDFTPAAQSGDPALAFHVTADAIGLPAGAARPLGPQIAKLEADGAVNGPIPIGRGPAEQATAWRDGGGALEIRHLAMVWGPLDLRASATLALDDQLQPMGTGNARLVGYAETLDALAAHGAISHSAATATKAVLSLMANNPDNGGPPEVEVPLTLQYRTLSMRQVPLVRLPELDWP